MERILAVKAIFRRLCPPIIRRESQNPGTEIGWFPRCFYVRSFFDKFFADRNGRSFACNGQVVSLSAPNPAAFIPVTFDFYWSPTGAAF